MGSGADIGKVHRFAMKPGSHGAGRFANSTISGTGAPGRERISMNHVAGNVFLGRGLEFAAVDSRMASLDLFQRHARHCVVCFSITARARQVADACHARLT